MHILFPDLQRSWNEVCKMCMNSVVQRQVNKRKPPHSFGRSILGRCFFFQQIREKNLHLIKRAQFFSNSFISYPHFMSLWCISVEASHFFPEPKKIKDESFQRCVRVVIVSDFSWWLLHAIVYTDNKVRKENNYNK